MSEWFSEETLAILIAVIKAVIILLVVVVAGAFLSFVERRLLALWQDRHGPNRVGPGGIFQLVADMLKMIFKEDWTPPFADKLTFWLAPAITMITILLMMALVPITPDWMVADFDVGLLIFFALAGLAVYSVILAGWSSNNKYSLLGGLRSTAQTISYEVFMGLSLMGIVMQAGSFNVRDIVLAQQAGWWNVVPQFFGFCVWSLAAIAVTHRTPFDLPEAESELAAGYHTEYSGMKFGMFFVGEYVGIVMVSGLTTALFFGGWEGPFWSDRIPFVWFAIKSLLFMSAFILLRAALPRPRYDQMMAAAWKVCLPLSLANLLITGAAILWQGSGA